MIGYTAYPGSMGDTQQIGSQGAGGERRYLTLLFADMCDYTSLAEVIEPDEVDGLRGQLEMLAQGIVGKHGGAISQMYGDGILAVFGMRAPTENDARCAVEAALELHQSIRGVRWEAALPAGFQVRLHSGVHAGLVFARQGDELHGRYELTGDAVNTAARLCAAAGRDELLVSSSVLRGIEAFFATEPRQLTLKGKKASVAAHRVTARSAVRTRFEARTHAGLTAFVNRENELAMLTSALAESSKGQGRIAVVIGPAGIGKTRLFEEFRQHVAGSGRRLLRGCCESYGEMEPLEPFIQGLRQLFAIQPTMRVEDATIAVATQLARIGGKVEQHAPTFMQLLSLRTSIEIALEQPLPVVAAVTQLVDVLSQHEPLLLILDDWQWADDVSREVLDRISADIDRRRLCILIGMRPTERIDAILERASVLQLKPLGEREAGRVIRSLRPQALDLEVARTLHRHSGGNPLFLEELCQTLPEQALTGIRALESRDIPNTIQGLIHARVAALPADQAKILRMASVMGVEFSYSLLKELRSDVELEATMTALAGGDMIYATDVPDIFRFKHGITREVIYESVRPSERTRLHRSIAEAIEHGVANADAAEQLEALAYHFRASQVPERAAYYAELAGNRALLSSSLDRAAFQYSSAMQELDKVPVTAEVKRRWLVNCNKWATAFVYSPALDHLDTIERASRYARELGDVRAQAYAEYWLGWTNYVCGEYRASIRHYQRALELAGASPTFATRVHLTLGQSHAAAGEYDMALKFLGEGLAAKRQLATDQVREQVDDGFVYALGCKGVLHALRGEFDLADMDMEEARTQVSNTGHAVEGSLLALKCIVEICRADFRACLEAAQQSRRIAERISGGYVFAMSSTFEGYAQFMLTHNADALLQMQESVTWLEARGARGFISITYACLAEALALSSELSLAREYALRAIARVEQGDPLGAAAAYRVLARVEAARGAETKQQLEDLVAKAFQSAKSLGSRREWALGRLLMLELQSGLGGPSSVAGLASEVQADLGRMGMTWHATQAARIADKG
jgi:class 3 adenylate cyclase/tetratricopeptide (TPR) repeat protein